MPPLHTYWTIILEGKPTAFRAAAQDELLPTLKQLQARHPDAVLMWFARGRLWKSEEESRAAYVQKRPPGDRRGPTWRPGGTHEDPRARFKISRDEKRKRFRERFELIAQHYPPKIPVDFDALADMMSGLVDGGIILSRILKDKDLLPKQVMLYRDFVRAVFLGSGEARL